MGFGNGTNAANVQKIARQVGAVSTDNGPGIGAYGGFKIFKAHPPQVVGRHDRQRRPLGFQLVQGAQDGIVFQHRGNHMVAGTHSPFDGNVQALGCIDGKCNPGRILRAKKLCHRAPGFIHRPGGKE